MRPYGGLTSGNPCGPRPQGPRPTPGPSRRHGAAAELRRREKAVGAARRHPVRRHLARPHHRRLLARRPLAPLSADRLGLPDLRSSALPAEPGPRHGRRPAAAPPGPPRASALSSFSSATCAADVGHVRARAARLEAPAPSCSTPTGHTACSFQDPRRRPATAPNPGYPEAATCQALSSVRTLGGVNSGPLRYCLKISRACAFNSGVKSIRSFS